MASNRQGGDYINVTWGDVSGAVEYHIYKGSFGGRSGYVATTGNTLPKNKPVVMPQQTPLALQMIGAEMEQVPCR